ncbi:WecG Teichoic acid biosynthesis proteins [Rhabdaerophilaceae bacterium]
MPARIPYSRAVVDGQRINIATQPEAVDAAITCAAEGRGFRFFTLNLDHLVKRRADATFAEAYRRAEFVSADGAPVARLARRDDPSIVRTTGADLVEPLCAEAAEKGVPLAFFGSDQATLEKSAATLRARYPGLNIVHCEAPPIGFEPRSKAAEEAALRIAASSARIVFVALGAPKQEFFSVHVAELTPAVGYVCIGAALDFIAGRQIRAPLFFQKTGLEWLWRLGTNPGRMARRYALCAGVLISILFAEMTGRKPALEP